MKLRYLATVVLLVLATVAAHAQSQGNVGLYLNPIAINVRNSVQDTGPFNFLGAGSTSRTFWGADFGGYYDFYHAANGLSAGIDLRQSILHANNAALKEFLIGVRVSGRPFNRPFKPYIQASFGAGASKSPGSQISVDKLDYRVYGGLDYTLQRHIDLRAIEVGYGSLKTISSATVGAGGTIAIPASTMLSFSTGLVFRF
jgi:hypothetical protein